MKLQPPPLPKPKRMTQSEFYAAYPNLEYCETTQQMHCGRSRTAGVAIMYRHNGIYGNREFSVYHEFKWNHLRDYRVVDSDWFRVLLSKSGRHFYSRSTTGAILMAWAAGQETWKKFQEEIPCSINPLNTRTDNMGNPTTTTLFEVNGKKNVFGTFLAKRPNGEYVLEMKDGSGAQAFSKDELTEVLPFTVSIKYLNERSSGSTYDYECEEGKVERGDLIIMSDGNIVEVTAVNTQSKRATKTLTGRKITSEAI